MKKLIPLVILAVCLSGSSFAGNQDDYANVVLCPPGVSKNPIPQDKFIKLVIDGPVIFYETTPIPDSDVTSYVNTLLETKQVSYIGVYIRQGTKYGDVVRGIDTLRRTNAKDVGLSMTELAPGRNP